MELGDEGTNKHFGGWARVVKTYRFAGEALKRFMLDPAVQQRSGAVGVSNKAIPKHLFLNDLATLTVENLNHGEINPPFGARVKE